VSQVPSRAVGDPQLFQMSIEGPRWSSGAKSFVLRHPKDAGIIEIIRKICGASANMKAALTPEDAVLDEIVRRLVASYQPFQVYLFGSKARGDPGPDSDCDLLVVVPDDAPPERKRSRLAYEVLRGIGRSADVLVCTRSYFEPRRSLKASLPGTVVREGRLLHGA